MGKTVALLFILACSTSSWATWTLTQVKDTAGCSTPCAVTVTSTGAGHLLVAGIVNPGGTTTAISSVTAATCNTTWTHAANTALGTANGTVDLFYCLNSVAAKTSISLTLTGTACGGSCVAVIWEAASSLGSIAVDTGAVPSQNRTGTSCVSPCAGVSLTLSGNNNFIAALGAGGPSFTGLAGTGFTNDLANPSGLGVAHGITSGSVTAPGTWTLSTTGTVNMDAAAFQESGGAAPACQPRLNTLGVSSCG